jgi:transcriptional regulator with XRE-family HTH domain
MDNLGTRLRDIRIKSGLSLRELARQAEVSPSFISQIENGKSQPSVATLYSFSRLLGVSVDDLFDARRDAPPAESVLAAAIPSHAAAGETLDRGGLVNPSEAWVPSEYANRISVVHPSHRSRLTMAAGVEWERLAATPEHDVNFMRIVYRPGATSTNSGELLSHAGYEYGYVIQGQVEITVGDETFTLRAGESLGFDSLIPHILRNTGTEEMHGIWFVHGAHS